MDVGRRSYGEELVAVLSAACTALKELPVGVTRLTGSELDRLLPAIDEVGSLAGAGRFTITWEAQERGAIAASQAGSVAQWIAERSPSLEPAAAGVVAKAVRDLRGPGLEPVRTAVGAGRLSVPAGAVVASELRQLTPLLADGAEAPVLAGLVEIGAAQGVPGVRALRTAMLAKYGLGEKIQDEQDRHAGLTLLTRGADIGGGITEYRMRLSPESRAIVEAAVNALSAPKVVDGVTDERTLEQRRGDALVDVCRKAVSLTPTLTTADGGDAAKAAALSGTKATLVVTIGLDDLRRRTRPGLLVGGLDAGTVLGPEAVRKLACDARVIPAVLGSNSEPLDLGHATRLFTSVQTRALWLRDRHCTFPGCRAPASWCDAHHLVHWVDGGATDLCNGALLCARHHSIVHRDRLHGTVTPTGVLWDRRPRSYDHALARSPLPDHDDDGQGTAA